jgi:hypothetical protein
MSLLAEFRRRMIWQVAVIYAIVARVLLQIVAIVRTPSGLDRDPARPAPAGWQFSYPGVGERDSAVAWLVRTLQMVQESVPDAGFVAFPLLKSHVRRDPVPEQLRLQKIFRQIDAIARSRWRIDAASEGRWPV